MISNATISRIDARSGVAGGVPTFTVGAAISIPCCMDEKTSSQIYALGSRVTAATAVIYVLAADLAEADAGELAEGMRVMAALEGQTAEMFEVVHVRPRRHGSLTHDEVFVRKTSG